MPITYYLNEDKVFKKLHLEPNGLAMQTLVETCLRLVEPYTPFRTGALIKSALTSSDDKSGRIGWYTPYARRLYYHPEYNFNGAPMRGAYWFERMKNDRIDDIINEVKKVIKND